MLEKVKSFFGEDEVEGNGLITGEGFGLILFLTFLVLC